MFSFTRKKSLLSPEQQTEIAEAIRNAEKRTSGEIRVFMENRCKFVDPLDRAAELFYGLKMEQTALRNAVLVYIAVKDHQLAIFADQGIHSSTGQGFWEKQVFIMLSHFNKDNYAAGIVTVIREIGEALCQHFPYDSNLDKNELPDEIVFGK